MVLFVCKGLGIMLALLKLSRVAPSCEALWVCRLVVDLIDDGRSLGGFAGGASLRDITCPRDINRRLRTVETTLSVWILIASLCSYGLSHSVLRWDGSKLR